MSISFLVAIMMAGQPVAPVPDKSLPNSKFVGVKFTGGDHDGMSIGWRVDLKGKTYVGLMPSKPNASPLPPEIAPIVNGLIDAYQKGDRAKYREFVLPTAKTYIKCLGCGEGIPFLEHEFRFKREENLVLNTPFLLPRYSSMRPDEYSVRLEWLNDGQIWYTSQIIIANGFIANFITNIASVPPLAAPSPVKSAN